MPIQTMLPKILVFSDQDTPCEYKARLAARILKSMDEEKKKI